MNDFRLEDIIIDLLESKDIDFDIGDAVSILGDKDKHTIDKYGWISTYFPLSFLRCEKLNRYPKNKILRQTIEDFIDYHLMSAQFHIWDANRNTLKNNGILSEKEISYEKLVSLGLDNIAQKFRGYYNKEDGVTFWIKVFSWIEDNRVNFGMHVENEGCSVVSYDSVSCIVPIGASYKEAYEILNDTLYSLTSQL